MRTVAGDVRNALDAARALGSRRFGARATAVELLERHVLDRLGYLEEGDSLPAELQAPRAEAEALCRQLEAANQQVVERFGRRLRSGRYTPAGLRRAFARCVPPGLRRGYDALDQLVSGLLDAGPMPEPRFARDPEMVFYQATPARAVLSFVERAGLRGDDVVYDLGAGLGRVVILAALLSGARATGIEIDPAYCEYAERCARALNVRRVGFVQADARDADFADGTVFFLYTPFRGALLRQVLERLHAVSRDHAIRVCTYGPCTHEVATERWLTPVGGGALAEDDVALFVPATAGTDALR